MIIELPFPPKELSPNARLHWRVVSKAKKACRFEAGVICRLAVMKEGFSSDGGAKLDFTFHPPKNYKYDRDNLIARSKAMIDGIADGLGIDDKHFTIGNIDLAPAVQGGLVRIHITETR